MTASLARFIGFLFVTATLLACASSRNAEPRYAEYSLDPSGHPEGIDCFYECVASNREAFRDACFARCEGVVATTTPSPCAPGSSTLCRSYEIKEEASCNADHHGDEETDSFVADLLTAGLTAALSRDRDHEKKSRSASKPKRRSSSSSNKGLGSKASSAAVKATIGTKKR